LSCLTSAVLSGNLGDGARRRPRRRHSMSKAKAYAVAIVPGGDFYQGGNPNDAEAQLPAAAPKVEKDKGGKERASAYIDFFDEHQNVKGDWWKCSNCEKAIRNAAPKKLYDEIKSHLLRMHDNEPASRSDTRTIAEVCFPVSVIIHREKMAAERLKRANEPPRTKELGMNTRAPMLETRTTALTVDQAIDALVAAGFKATKQEITSLTTEVKKRIRVAPDAEDADKTGKTGGTSNGAGSSGDATAAQGERKPKEPTVTVEGSDDVADSRLQPRSRRSRGDQPDFSNIRVS